MNRRCADGEYDGGPGYRTSRFKRCDAKYLQAGLIRQFPPIYNEPNPVIPIIRFEKMDQILQFCQHRLSGHKLAPAQEQAMEQFFLAPANAENILQMLKTHPPILVCYKHMTQRARRNGSYFGDAETARKVITGILGILDGIPSYPTQHENNVYLGLQGELLAGLVNCEVEPTMVPDFLLRKVWQQEAVLEVKVHCMLKIITACLEELVEIREKHTLRSGLKKKIMSFVNNYGNIFMPIITTVGKTICENFEGFQRIGEIISNLQLTQESFLTVMGQQEPPQNMQGETSPKPFVLKWEIPYLCQWVTFYCFFLDRILKIYFNPQQADAPKLPKSTAFICRCVTLATHIYELSLSQERYRPEGFRHKIQSMLLMQLLIPFIDRFIGKDTQHMRQLSPQFHVAILKLFLSTPLILKSFFKGQVETAEQATNSITKIKDYCQYVIENYYFYFTQFEECPVGLSIKLMFKVKGALQDLIKQSCNLAEKDFSDLDVALESIHQMFFETFVVTKLLLNGELSTQEEDLFNDCQDWQDFIKNSLNLYFADMALYAPRYFSATSVLTPAASSPESNISKQNPRSKSVGQLAEEEEEEEEEYELQKQFENDPGYKLFSAMIANLSFGKLFAKKDRFIISTNDESLENDGFGALRQHSEPAIFSNLMPILACFKALIDISINSEIKGHLFYEFYQVSYEIDVGSFSQILKPRAKICKLYIIHCFIEQILPDNFALLGEGASSTITHVTNSCGLDLEGIIIDITDQIASCMEKASDFEEDEIAIVNYAISLLEIVARKLSDRIYEIQESHEIMYRRQALMYENRIDFIFQTIMDLEMNTAEIFYASHSVAGILIDLCGMQNLYDIYEKLSEDTISVEEYSFQFVDLQLYFAGCNGLLGGLSKTGTYRAAAELIIENMLRILPQIEKLMDQELFQGLFDLVDNLTNEKLYSQTHNQLTIAAAELFHQLLPPLLGSGMQITAHQKKVQKLYVKLSNLSLTSPLIPLPDNLDPHKHHQLLSCYFGSITRLQDLGPLQNHALLRADWLISFLQAKIERDQHYSIDIETIAINIRFEREIKMEKLASLIAIVMGLKAQEVLDRLYNKFVEVDSVFYSRVGEMPQHTGQ